MVDNPEDIYRHNKDISHVIIRELWFCEVFQVCIGLFHMQNSLSAATSYSGTIDAGE